MTSSAGESFDKGLRVTGFVLGLLLLAYFFVPVCEQGTVLCAKGQFLWERLRAGALDDAGFMLWIYPAGMGLLLIILGLIPLPAAVRGAMYAAFGAAPFLYLVAKGRLIADGANLGTYLSNVTTGLDIAAKEISWRMLVLAGTLFVLPFGHYLRARRWDSIAARILVALGIAGLLAAYLYPLALPGLSGAGKLPVVAAFEGVRGGSPMGYVVASLIVLPVLFALFSFGAFASSSSSGGGNFLGTLFLLWVPLAFVGYIVHGAVRGAPPVTLLSAGRLLVFSFCCQFFVVYGLVHLFPARRPR